MKKEITKNIIVIEIPDNINLNMISKLLSDIHINDKGCWIRGNDSMKYTSIKFEGKRQQAHRVSYEIFKGKKIPYNLNGCHECDIKACINPEHIFPGDDALNIQDARIKGRIFPVRIKKSKWANFPKLRQLLKGY